MGWKALPVRCGSCGRLFPADNVIGGNATVTLENVYVKARCPWCGSAEGGLVPDGTYSMGESVSRDLARLNEEEVKQLRGLLTHARATLTDESVQALAGIAPAIAEAIRSRPKSSWAAIIGTILMLIALWKPAAGQEVNVHVEVDAAGDGDGDVSSEEE